MVTKTSAVTTRKSSNPGAVPSAGQLQHAELAINTADRRLYSKDASGAVFQVAPSLQATKVNVKHYGAKIDGTTDDAAPLASAYSALGKWGTIVIPSGGLQTSAWPTASKTTDGVKLWQLEGTTYGTSGVVINGASGADTVETFGLGSKFFSRLSSYQNAGPIVRIDGKFDHVGGDEGNVINSFLVNTTIETNSPNFVWGGLFVTSSKGLGGGQHAGLISAMKRPADALADGFGPRDQIFGNYTEVMDMPEVLDADTAGSAVGYELDLFCHGTDLLRRRQVLSINIGKPYNTGSDGEVGRGVHLNTNNAGSYFGTMFSATANFRIAAIDLTDAGALNGNARHIRLPANGKIGWGPTGTNVFDIQYASNGLAEFNMFGASKMRIADDPTNAVYIFVGGALRSVTIKDRSALVDGDKVMVAV